MEGHTLEHLVAVDGEVEVAGASLGVKVHIGFAHDVVAQHGYHHVFGVTVVCAVNHHLSTQRHLASVAAGVVVVPGAEGLDFDHDFQRFAEAVLIGEIDDFGVDADGQVMVDGETQADGLLRVDAAVGLADAHPAGQTLDGELVSASADVLDVGRKFEVVDHRLVEDALQTVLAPQQHVLVHIHLPHGGAHGAVAVEVLDVAYGDEDVVLVDFAVEHVDVDEQLVLVEAPVEVHLGQQAAFAHGGDVLVGRELGVEG